MLGLSCAEDNMQRSNCHTEDYQLGITVPPPFLIHFPSQNFCLNQNVTAKIFQLDIASRGHQCQHALKNLAAIHKAFENAAQRKGCYFKAKLLILSLHIPPLSTQLFLTITGWAEKSSNLFYPLGRTNISWKTPSPERSRVSPKV